MFDVIVGNTLVLLNDGVLPYYTSLTESFNYDGLTIPRRAIAIDEVGVKANGRSCWVYAAVDIDRNEVIAIKAYKK